ncbi:MAG: hypothetical protein ACLR4Z_13810 [Butyricicoccaceae bacterium]
MSYGEECYSIDGNTITLKKDLLHVGENALKIESAGYKPQTVKFTLQQGERGKLSCSGKGRLRMRRPSP